jgi:hypothetical protein
MAYNPDQYKAKKKRVVDPNAPPRPNLLSHDKVIREQKDIIMNLQLQIRRQAEELESLKNKYNNMQQSITGILSYLRKGK